MRSFLLTCIGLFVLLSACGGRIEQADCSYEGAGATYCHWDPSELPPGSQSEVCCPGSYPYCGKAGTNCPVGKCCNAVPQ